MSTIISDYAYNLGTDIAILRGMVWDTFVDSYWMVRFSKNNKLIKTLRKLDDYNLLYRSSLDDLLCEMFPSDEYLPTHPEITLTKVFYMNVVQTRRMFPKDICYPRNKFGHEIALVLRPFPNTMTYWQRKFLMKIVVGIINLNFKKDIFINMCTEHLRKENRRVFQLSIIKREIKKRQKKQKKQLDKLLLLIMPMAKKRRDTFLRNYIKDFNETIKKSRNIILFNRSFKKKKTLLFIYLK